MMEQLMQRETKKQRKYSERTWKERQVSGINCKARNCPYKPSELSNLFSTDKKLLTAHMAKSRA